MRAVPAGQGDDAGDPSGRAVLVASLVDDPAQVDLAELSAAADILEVRADRIGEVDIEALRRAFPGRLLFTLRSRAEGGRGPNGGHDREDQLCAAAGSFDLVDVEAERDLSPEILDRVPAERRIISWHGRASDPEELAERFDRMSKERAALYKLVCLAEGPGQATVPLALLHKLGRDDVTAFASGAVGSWTRLLAPRLGARVVYGAADRSAAPGQPTVARLRRDFGLPELPPVRKLFGLVGRRIEGSLSPRLHNGLYRALGLDHLYLSFDVPVFGDFWLDLVEAGSLQEVGLPLAGLSVTAPFKEVALAVAGAASPLAEHIGSANTLVRHGGGWEGESTDPDAVTGALDHHGVVLGGARVAVLGAGGAGRAAAFAAAGSGGDVTLINRSPERGRRSADRLGLSFGLLDLFDPSVFDVIINATPLGRRSDDALPFDPEATGAACVVLDLVYREDRPTSLVEAARRLGRLAIDGREALLFQAVRQFRLMTDVAMPPDLGRRILELEPAGGGS